MERPVTPQQPRISAPTAWQITPSCPAEWQGWMNACDAGFFHSPKSLQTGAPAGEPLFCVHSSPDGVDGVAVGVRHACRLSRQARHVYFPSIPALRDTHNGAGAIEDLVAALSEGGAAEVIMDSFDATWCHGLPGATACVRREEFVIALGGTREEMLARCSQHHRRHIRRGDRAGWTVRAHLDSDASRVLDVVQTGARQRTSLRAASLDASSVAGLADHILDSTTAWGATVFAAWDGEVMLAAILVGWGGRRAYYIAGGGTPEGYAVGAAAWLQWHITVMLASGGWHPPRARRSRRSSGAEHTRGSAVVRMNSCTLQCGR